MSFGGGSQGEIKYRITVDNQQALQGIKTTTAAINEMPQAMNSVTQSSQGMLTQQERINQALKDNRLTLEQVTLSQKSFGSVLKDSILGIGNFASGVIGLVAHITQLERAGNRLQSVRNTEAGMLSKLEGLQRKYNAAVVQYGANSREAFDLQAKIEALQKKHSTTLDKIKIMQQAYNERLADFAVNILPNVIQTATGLTDTILNIKKWADAKKAVDAVTGSMQGLGSGMRGAGKAGAIITAVLIALEIGSQAVAHNWGGFRDRLGETYNWLVKLAPAFKPVIDALFTIGEATVAIFTGDWDKLNKMFAVNKQGAIESAGAMDDTTDAIAESGKEAEQTQKKIADMWDEIGQAPNLQSALKIDINKDKLTKKFLDYLPDSLTKDIKVFLKGKESVNSIRDSFMETFDVAVNQIGGKDDKWADKFVQQTNKMLKEKFPKDPTSQKMQEELAATVSGPDTLDKVKALIEKWKLGDTGTDLGTQIGANVTKGITTVMGDPLGILDSSKTERVSKGKEFKNGVWTGGFLYEDVKKKPTMLGSLLDQIKTFATVELPKAIKQIGAVLSDPKTWSAMINGLSVAGAILKPIFDSMTYLSKSYLDPAVAALLSPQNWYDAIAATVDTLTKVGEGIGKAVGAAIEVFAANPGEAFKNAGIAIVGALSTAFAALKSVDWSGIGSTILKGVGTWFTINMPKTSKELDAIATAIGKFVASVNSDLVKLWQDFGTALEPVTNFFTSINTGVASAWDSLSKAVTSTVSGMKPLIDAGATVIDALTKLFALKNPFSPAVQMGDNNGKVHPVGLTLGSGAGQVQGQISAAGADWLVRQLEMSGIHLPPALKSGNTTIDEILSFVQDPYGWTKSHTNLPQVPEFKAPELLHTVAATTGGGGMCMGEFGPEPCTGGFKGKSAIDAARMGNQGPLGDWNRLFNDIAGLMTMLTKHWSQAGNTLNKTSQMVLNNSLKHFNRLFDDIAGLMTMLTKFWSKAGTTLNKTSQMVLNNSLKHFNRLFDDVAGLMTMLTKWWSKSGDTLNKTSQMVLRNSLKHFNRLFDDVAGLMNMLDKHWVKVANHMIRIAADTANDINDALAKIKDVDVNVTIHVGVVGGGGVSKSSIIKRIGTGGTFSFAEGGIISAAKGFTTNGPQLVMIGDNPGGRETVAVIPRDNPTPTMQLLDRQVFGESRGNGGSVIINLTNVLNDREVTRSFRRSIGQDIYRFGPT